MQRFYSNLFLAMLCLLLPGTLLLAQGENLIPNPSFEEGDGNTFTNWTAVNGADNVVETTEAENVYEGDRALQINSPGSESQPWQVQVTTDSIETFVGNSYTFSIWAKAEEAGGSMRFSTQPGQGTAQYGGDLEIPTDWTRISYTFVANVPKTVISMDLAYDVATFYFDAAEMLAPAAPCVDTFSVDSTQTPIAAGKNKFIGSVYGGSQSDDFEYYFNQVTPENAGKWGSVEGTRDTFDFQQLDSIRAFAARNDFPFRYHVLLWGAQQPTWLKPLSDEEKVEEIIEWISGVANHFDGSSDARATLEYVEVLNEFINQPPDNLGQNADDNGSGDYIEALRSLNDSLSTTAGEYDWIVNAFKIARSYFPCEETKLMLNEYNVVNGGGPTTMHYVEVAQLLDSLGLVDVLGFQGHAFSTRVYTDVYDEDAFTQQTATLTEKLDSLAMIGLPLMVTELEIDGNTDGTYTATEDQMVADSFQLAEYERVFGLFWNHPSVIGITLWGYRTGLWRTDQDAYIIDPCTDAPRPALAEYLNDSLRRADNPPLNEFTYCQPSSIFSRPVELATSVEIFPNPTGGSFTVRLGTALNRAELRIYDQLGKEVARRNADGLQTIPLNAQALNLRPGAYILTLTAEGKRTARRLIVTR
ncbi:MAG: endo-1,4-beta-xylanase [Lewinella sp.]